MIEKEWRMVPVEPTKEMREVIRNEKVLFETEDGLYDALLTTAPSPPKSDTCATSERFKYRGDHPHGPNVIDLDTGRWMSVGLVREMASVLPNIEPCDRNAVIEECSQFIESEFDLCGDEIIIAERPRVLKSQPAAPCQECGSKQAKIDRLMWEFCPEEMAPDQVEEWEKHQVSCSDKCHTDGGQCGIGGYCKDCHQPAAIDAALKGGA